MKIILLNFYLYMFIFTFIGYGSFLSKILKLNKENLGIGLIGILGIFFLSTISLTTQLFLPHNYSHNIVILLIGLVLFFYQIKLREINKNQIIKILLISFVFSIGLYIFKNHDDFPYYHFSYIYNLTENKFQIGLGYFSHGFRTQSILFYLQSLTFLPLIKYYLFNSIPLIIMIFANMFFLENINLKKKNTLDFSEVLSLLCLVFINIVFYRIAEHGTDRSGQIIVFIIFILMFQITNLETKNFSKIKALLLLLVFSIMIKTYFVVYGFLVFILIYSFIKKKYFLEVIKEITNFNFLFISSLALILNFTNNFANTGCLIYPIEFTCFANVKWSLIDQVPIYRDWYEVWAKGGASPNFRVEDPQNYIKGFNWVDNWFRNHFFSKITDTIGAIIFICVVFYLSLVKYKKNINKQKFFWPIYISLTILLFEWFLNHPTLRYGGFVLISLIFFIPLSKFLQISNLDFKMKKFFCISLIAISFFIFVTRNISRIYKEYNQYNYNIIENPFYNINNKSFVVNDRISDAKLKKNYELNYKKFLTYDLFYKK